jgi:hypothetical protein
MEEKERFIELGRKFLNLNVDLTATLCEDKEILLYMLRKKKINGDHFWPKNTKFENDEEVLKAFVKSYPKLFHRIGLEYYGREDFLLEIISQKPKLVDDWSLRNSRLGLSKNQNFILKVVRYNEEILEVESVNHNLCENPEFIEKLAHVSPEAVFLYIDEKMITEEILKIFAKSGKWRGDFEELEKLDTNCEIVDALFQHTNLLKMLQPSLSKFLTKERLLHYLNNQDTKMLYYRTPEMPLESRQRKYGPQWKSIPIYKNERLGKEQIQKNFVSFFIDEKWLEDKDIYFALFKMINIIKERIIKLANVHFHFDIPSEPPLKRKKYY